MGRNEDIEKIAVVWGLYAQTRVDETAVRHAGVKLMCKTVETNDA